MQLTHKFNIKFKVRKFIININDVQHNLRIFIIFFDKLTINVIKTLMNNHANFKFNDVNEELKIV